MSPPVSASEWDESPSALDLMPKDTGTVFESFFDRSVDAVWLLDQQAGVFVDCNQAAVKLIGAENKQQLMRTRPEDLSPPLQSDGHAFRREVGSDYRESSKGKERISSNG
jgi:PAS domain-containing protein